MNNAKPIHRARCRIAMLCCLALPLPLVSQKATDLQVSPAPFAALGDIQWEPWLTSMMRHLSKGTPAVLAHFAHNPFPDAPPRYVRAAYYDYRFTTPGELLTTGRWWKREYLRLYAQPIDGGER